MRGEVLRHTLLTGVKRGRGRLADALRGTRLWHPARALYRTLAPLWQNAGVRRLLVPLRRRLYASDPRGYWQTEGRRYMQDEAGLRGAGSMSERQGEFLAAELARLEARSVLEMGCGYGRLLRELRPRLPVPLTGADFSASQLGAARGYLGARPVPLVLADATEGLPFRDGAFDVVFTQGSLMHVPGPLARRYRSELARVSRRYVIHTEDTRETETTFAHDNEAHYRALGRQLVKRMPYPLNLPGQQMMFEVFASNDGARS